MKSSYILLCLSVFQVVNVFGRVRFLTLAYCQDYCDADHNDLRSQVVAVGLIDNTLSGSKHSYKYRLAFVVAGECVLRYDNETGKGDHKHMRGKEVKYRFVSVDKLVADFFKDVKRWRDENNND